MCNYQKLTTGPSENKLSSVNKPYFHYFSPTRGEHHVEHYVVSSEIKIEKWEQDGEESTVGRWVVTFHHQNPTRGEHHVEHYGHYVVSSKSKIDRTRLEGERSRWVGGNFPPSESNTSIDPTINTLLLCRPLHVPLASIRLLFTALLSCPSPPLGTYISWHVTGMRRPSDRSHRGLLRKTCNFDPFQKKIHKNWSVGRSASTQGSHKNIANMKLHENSIGLGLCHGNGHGHFCCRCLCCLRCIRCLRCPRCLTTQNMRAEKRRNARFHWPIQTQPKLKKLDSQAHLMTHITHLPQHRSAKRFQAGINVFSY